MKVSKTAKRALIVAILLNLCTGAQYCWSMLGSSMINSYGWTSTQATLPYTILMIVAATWAVGAGAISDRSKPKYATMLGAITMGAGLIISGNTTSPIVMLFSVGILMGLASTSVTTTTANTAVKFWPVKYKGVVSGAVTAAVALSPLYMAPIINALLASVGISKTFIFVGIAAFILLFALSLVFPTPDAETLGQHDYEKDEPAVVEEDNSKYQNKLTAEQSLKKYEMWVLFGCMGCAAMSGQMLTAHLAEIGLTRAGWQAGFVLVMIMAVGNALGRLILPSIADKIGCFNSWRLLFVVAIINMLGFTKYSTITTIAIGTILLAACYGACVPLTWSSIASVFGKKYMGTLYGYINISFGIASFIGPMAAAWIFDATGSYTNAFILVAAFQGVGLILSFLVKDNKKKDSKKEIKAEA